MNLKRFPGLAAALASLIWYGRALVTCLNYVEPFAGSLKAVLLKTSKPARKRSTTKTPTFANFCGQRKQTWKRWRIGQTGR